MKFIFTIIIWLTFKSLTSAQSLVGTSVSIQNAGDNVLSSVQGNYYQQLIGTYAGWDQEAIFIAGYNYFSTVNTNATKRIFLGGAYSGSSYMTMDLSTGSMGLNTGQPQSYFHGGNNKVFEILNNNNSANSQAHVILSTGATVANSGAGTISWIAKNASGNKGMAYIGASTTDDASNNASARLVFATANGNNPIERMVIDKNGLVGIGTETPREALSVNGTIRSKEVKVETANWPDYVFKPNYQLPPLAAVKKYLDKNQHLQDIPSEAEVIKDGISLG